MIWKMVLTSLSKMRSRGDLRAGDDVHPSSEEGIRDKAR